jgi:hypothetical protein
MGIPMPYVKLLNTLLVDIQRRLTPSLSYCPIALSFSSPTDLPVSQSLDLLDATFVKVGRPY